MDYELHKVYEYMKSSKELWPEEITADNLRLAYRNSGRGGSVNFWADNRGLDVGEYPNQKHYTWTRIAKFFREAENENHNNAGHSS